MELEKSTKCFALFYFLDIHEIEGIELARIVILFYGIGCGGRMLYCFHNMITRACLKLVFVGPVDKKMYSFSYLLLLIEAYNLATKTDTRLLVSGQSPECSDCLLRFMEQQ